jgi:hypothetical protein
MLGCNDWPHVFGKPHEWGLVRLGRHIFPVKHPLIEAGIAVPQPFASYAATQILTKFDALFPITDSVLLGKSIISFVS